MCAIMFVIRLSSNKHYVVSITVSRTLMAKLRRRTKRKIIAECCVDPFKESSVGRQHMMHLPWLEKSTELHH